MNKLLSAAFLLPLLASATGCLEDEAAPVAEESAAVVQGTFEPDYRFPWEVSLNGCHGVLLDPQWVLTAAHCVPMNGWSYQVGYQRTDPSGTSHSETRRVSYSGVFVHPDYQLGGGFDAPKNDVALIRLDQPFDIQPWLQTVALPSAPRVIGHVGAIAGGSHSTSTLPESQAAVYRATIPATNPGFCAAPDGAFCVASTDASLCPGDSGSGFVTTENGRATVTGIASFAHWDSCETHSPDDYAGMTDVYTFRDWILRTMGKSDATLAGNTRVRFTGRAALGVFGLGCTNPYDTMWGPLPVAGTQVGANCAPGDTQSVVCSIQGQLSNVGGIPVVIKGFKMKTTYANGTSTVTSLPVSSSTWASYYGTLPAGVTREFTCELSSNIIIVHPGQIGGVTMAQ